MVLGKLSQISFSENIIADGFIKGFVFCLIGTILGFIFFPKNALLIAVFFSTIALMPSVGRVLSLQELLEGRIKQVNDKKNVKIEELNMSSQKTSPFFLLKENFPLFKFYTAIFFGMMVFFLMLFFVLPENQVNSLSIQIRFGSGFANDTGNAASDFGNASYEQGLFFDYVSNNMLVLVVGFIIALFFGEGAIFLIAWNAAYWATIFVLRAKGLSAIAGADPLILIALIFFSVFVHMGLETLSYLMAIISGGIISKGFSREKLYGERFSKILINSLIILAAAVIVLIIAAWWESTITPTIVGSILPNY